MSSSEPQTSETIEPDLDEPDPTPAEPPTPPPAPDAPPPPDAITWEPFTWYSITYACLTEGCVNENQVRYAPMFYSNDGKAKNIRVYDSACKRDCQILTAEKLDPQPEEE